MAVALGRPLLAAALLLTVLAGQAAAAETYETPVRKAASNKGLRARAFKYNGKRHFFQIPKKPVGTLVWFPGCKSARGFFPKSSKCKGCTGLPEHVSATKQALARRYALLAMAPAADDLCWSSSTANGYVNDQEDVIPAIKAFLQDRGLQGKPVILIGASSGGMFALKLADRLAAGKDGLQVDGVISEVNAPEPDKFFRNKERTFPPTVFITMERDKGQQAQAALNIAHFASVGQRAAHVVSPIRQVTPSFFSDRSPVISPDQSFRIVAELAKIGLLGSDGLLQADPGTGDWLDKLRGELPWLKGKNSPLTLVTRHSHILMELKVAYAEHEHVSDYTTASLAWLESGGKQDLGSLVRKHAVPGGKLSELTIKSKL